MSRISQIKTLFWDIVIDDPFSESGLYLRDARMPTPRFILKVKVCFDGESYNANIIYDCIICFFMDEKVVTLTVSGSLFTSSLTNSDDYTQVSRTTSARLSSVYGKTSKQASSLSNPVLLKVQSYFHIPLVISLIETTYTSSTAKDIHKELVFCSIFENMQKKTATHFRFIKTTFLSTRSTKRPNQLQGALNGYCHPL